MSSCQMQILRFIENKIQLVSFVRSASLDLFSTRTLHQTTQKNCKEYISTWKCKNLYDQKDKENIRKNVLFLNLPDWFGFLIF